MSKFWLAFSGALVLAAIICTAVFGLNFGIDFTGGSLIEAKFEQSVSTNDVRDAVSSAGFESVVQQGGEDNSYLIRTEDVTREQHDAILSALTEQLGNNEELRFESIGPVIGQELKRKSLEAVVLLLVLIVLYVAWAFRKVSKPVASWKYGVLTIIAAMHDVILPVGVFAILGKVFGYQIDTAFIAAVLTILGYSINDTIVVFDRTRENLVAGRHSDESFAEIVDKSVVQTLGRSVNTSFTTMLVLLAIFIFGGDTTRSFVLALMIGVFSGAYSSIFVASPLLVEWEKWSNRKGRK